MYFSVNVMHFGTFQQKIDCFCFKIKLNIRKKTSFSPGMWYPVQMIKGLEDFLCSYSLKPLNTRCLNAGFSTPGKNLLENNAVLYP